MILMELELSRMAFFCDMHSQWCALPSLATWSQLPRAAVPVHSGLKALLRKTFKHQAQKLSISPPLPPSSDFSLLCRLSRKPKCELNVWESSTKLGHPFLGWYLKKSQPRMFWGFFFFFSQSDSEKSTTKVVGEIGFKAVRSFPYGKYQGLSHWNM